MPSEITLLFGRNVDRVAGIYCAIHRDSGMCYVGSSVNIRKRWAEHLAQARNGRGTLFHKALRDFGIRSFDCSILEECEQSSLLDRERFYIALMGSASIDGFNTRSDPTATYSPKVSPATCARISASKKGMNFTPAQRARIIAGMLGGKRTKETRSKMSISAMGKTFTEEHRANIRKSREGMRLSIEHKAAISAGGKGRIFSAETRKKLSESKLAKIAVLGRAYSDIRKAIVVTDLNGKFLMAFESLLDAVDGLETSNGNLRYYLKNERPCRGMLFYYATIERHAASLAS